MFSMAGFFIDYYSILSVLCVSFVLFVVKNLNMQSRQPAFFPLNLSYFHPVGCS